MRKFAIVSLLTIVVVAASLCWFGYGLLHGVTYLGRDGVYLQRSSWDCGEAALKMIFDHYEIPVAYDDLLSQLGTSGAGTSMLSLKKLSEAKGLHCEGWHLTFEDLRHAPLPVILFLHGNHYVVLDSFTPSGEVLLRDPARGKLLLSPRKLKSIWKGEALLFLSPL
jgi:ABC-type bacteriocin/lantibiotic exporter with double-glycine peptidase domain